MCKTGAGGCFDVNNGGRVTTAVEVTWLLDGLVVRAVRDEIGSCVMLVGQ